MHYAILCYNSEDMIAAWTKEQDATVMADLAVVNDKIAKRGRLGPVARLGPTNTARTLRKERGQPFLITDGPYAETKEQILGFWIVECDSEDEAMDMAKDLGTANPGGAFEIRPVIYLKSNTPVEALAEPNVAP